MSSAPRPCAEIGKWLRVNVGKYCLAPLTGQDHAALFAIAHLLNAYARSDDNGRKALAVALAYTASAMQPSVRYLVKRAVPYAMDWSHESEVWEHIIESAPDRLWSENCRKCAGELVGDRCSCEATS